MDSTSDILSTSPRPPYSLLHGPDSEFSQPLLLQSPHWLTQPLTAAHDTNVMTLFCASMLPNDPKASRPFKIWSYAASKAPCHLHHCTYLHVCTLTLLHFYTRPLFIMNTLAKFDKLELKTHLLDKKPPLTSPAVLPVPQAVSDPPRVALPIPHSSDLSTFVPSYPHAETHFEF